MSTTSYTAPRNNPTDKTTTYRLEAASTTSANNPNSEPTTAPASSCDPDIQLPHNLATGPSTHITTDSTVSTTSCSFCYTA